MCLIISNSESANPLDENFRPSRFFIWAPMIMSEVAEVKAFVTGTDIKSTTKPVDLFKFVIFFVDNYTNGSF